MRLAIREVLIACLFLGFAIAMTWPLTPNITRAVSDPGDPFFSTWVLDWDYHATRHGLSLFDANIFYPARTTLAFSEHMYGISLLLFPLFAFGVAPLTIHNIGLLLGFAACGYAMYLLARWATQSAAAGVIGGIAYAFVGFRFHHLPHLHFVWAPWLPLLLLSLLVFAEKPNIPRAAAFGIVFTFNGLSTLHWFAFGSFAIGITAILVAAATSNLRIARYWTLLAAAVTLALLILAPFFLPYLQVAKEYGMHRYYSEALAFSSPEWRDWLQPSYQNKLYGMLSPSAAFGREGTLLPGVLVYALAILGLLVWRRDDIPPHNGASGRSLLALDIVCAGLLLAATWGAMAGTVTVRVVRDAPTFTGAAAPGLAFLACFIVRCWLRWPGSRTHSLREAVTTKPSAFAAAVLWVVVGAMGARGLHGVLDSFLFDQVSAFRSIRVPVRWAMIAYVGLSLLASAGAAHLLRGKSIAARALLAVLIGGSILLELRTAPLRWYLAPQVPQPVYEWLRDAPFRGGIVELPISQQAAYEYLLHATVHHRPLLNGVSSYTPPGYEELAALYKSEPISDELFTQLERRRCSLIVVHDGLIQTRSVAVRDWLSRGVASGRLAFVRRFDAGTRPDYVFALTRVEPAAASWRAPSQADPAGFTPDQNAQRFLAGDPLSYSAQTIANIDRGPVRFQRGPLEISGWATSPVGIDHVNVSLANQTVVLLAKRTDRGDVSAILPWHPAVYGFSLVIPKPPKAATGDTDLQVQVVDRRGGVRLMPPSWFRWTLPLRPLPWKTAALDGLLRRLDQDPDKTRALVLDGRASIHDYVDQLVTDPAAVTDMEFVRHTVNVLLGDDPSPALIDPYLRSLSRGTSRERVVDEVLQSKDFENRYIAREGRQRLLACNRLGTAALPSSRSPEQFFYARLG